MITATPGGVQIAIRVIPRAGRSGLAGTRDEAVLVRLAAAPVDGAANAELIEVLAEAFGVSRRQVTLVAGERARQKRVRIDGLSVDEATAVVAAAASRR